DPMTRTLLSLLLATAAFAAQSNNTPPPGYKALWNGKDLTGWQGLVEYPERAKLTKDQFAAKQKEANEKYLPHWAVTPAGVLHYHERTSSSLKTLTFQKAAAPRADGKTRRAGNPGTARRGTPQEQMGAGRAGAGGLFNKKKTPGDRQKTANKPAGEWNTFRIV